MRYLTFALGKGRLANQTLELFEKNNYPIIVINDLNNELMTTYRVIRDNPNQLMDELDEMKEQYDARGADYYKEVREYDRQRDYCIFDDYIKAARLIFLNKTCFNGLYRVNSEGFFNTPMGRNKCTSFYDKRNIINISSFLKMLPDENIMNGSYKDCMRRAALGDVVYVDPPYDYTENDGFTKYQKEGFSHEDLAELKIECDRCIEAGATIILSNNNTKKVRDIFGNDSEHDYIFYSIEELNTKRMINCKGDNRLNGKEIIIWGLPLKFPMTDEMGRLLSYIRLKDVNDIKDDTVLAKRFNVKNTTVTKVISTLRYFGIIDSKRCFTEKGVKIRDAKNNKDASKELKSIIIENKLFGDVYNYDIQNMDTKLSTNNIKDYVIFDSPNIKDSIALHRAKIIFKIIQWCILN